MRHFTSVGPLDPEIHFSVPRTELVDRCINQLVGTPSKGGTVLSLFAPRQSGATWLLHRVREQILALYGEQFTVVTLSLMGLMKEGDPDGVFLANIPSRIEEALSVSIPALPSFEEWQRLFRRPWGLFDRPVILLLDEFHSLTPSVVETLVGLFRQMFLARESYYLHGLALSGLRSQVGVDNALHLPNLSQTEVKDLVEQYQQQSGQAVDASVVQSLYEATCGQPGLCCLLLGLLSETYNPGKGVPIGNQDFQEAYAAALHIEPHNTLLTLRRWARRYKGQVLTLFQEQNVPFSLGQPWCNDLYLGGVIDWERTLGEDGKPQYLSRFASPFVQKLLFADLAAETQLHPQVPVLDVLDDVTDPLAKMQMDLVCLLGRYHDYQKRLAASGERVWSGPFPLHRWLVQAIGGLAAISVEFPSGSGLVALHLSYRGQVGVIVMAHVTSKGDVATQREQASNYARSRDLSQVTLAMFVPGVPGGDEIVLAALAIEPDSSRQSLPIPMVYAVAIPQSAK